MTDAPSPKVKGPASYFPSIEQRYGRPIDDWIAIVRARRGERHSDRVTFLKTEHGMGHGHANAVVHYTLAKFGKDDS